MIEAMQYGTPVIAWDCGSVPEVINDGVTGFIVDNIDDAVRAVQWAGKLNRSACRKVFETRFSAERMAQDYLAVYRRLLGQTPRRGRPEFEESRRPVAVG
jgi:glycosyltransferase involved in cell wall biosynthesis